MTGNLRYDAGKARVGRWWYWPLAALLALSGCAGVATMPPATPSTAPATATMITPRAQFSMAGRFSAKGEREQASGQFRYTETPARRTLSLFSPLGTALAEVVAEGGVVTLTDANGGRQVATSVAELLRPMIDLPVQDAALSAWLQGLPAAGEQATAVERDVAGWPLRFRQSGWDIEIGARQADTGAPRRMRWSLPAQPEIEVRWVIDEWSAP